MSFVVSNACSGSINYWHLRWGKQEEAGHVVWGETQESATLTRKMWCELNMKTNELSHVQRCFTLPAPISICPSGQQAWIRHWEGRECGGVEERGSPFPSRLADAPSGPLKPNDIRLTKKSRLTSRLILSCFKTPLLKLLRHDASLDAFIWFFLTPAPLIFP